MMMTVTRILTVFMMKVKRRYLAMRGSTSEVGGRIFIIIIVIIIISISIIITLETSSRNTTSERRMLIPSVTCTNS